MAFTWITSEKDLATACVRKCYRNLTSATLWYSWACSTHADGFATAALVIFDGQFLTFVTFRFLHFWTSLSLASVFFAAAAVGFFEVVAC